MIINYDFPKNVGQDNINFDNLSYDYVLKNSNMNGKLIIQPGGWYASAFAYQRGWMFLHNGYSASLPTDDLNYINNKNDKKSFKLYISVAYKDVPKVWNAVLPLIIAGGFQMKAVASDNLAILLENSSEQHGKTIVVYINNPDSKPKEYWISLFTKIESLLRSMNLKRQAPTECIPLKGSHFISYRQETIQGHYAMSANAIFSDVFHDISLT